MATMLCRMEDFDCANLKPNVTSLRSHAIHGLAASVSATPEEPQSNTAPTTTGSNRNFPLFSLSGHRSKTISTTSSSNNIGTEDPLIPSYNDIMKRHRQVRVYKFRNAAMAVESDIQGAVADVYKALDAVQALKKQANNYDWDGLRSLIRQDVLSTKLSDATILLRGASSLSLEARSEIGFDWGSCAWRHCGAAADAQEALAELYNLSGVLEPYECHFIINIVERSLRDMLAMIPPEFMPNGGSVATTGEYPVHQSQNMRIFKSTEGGEPEFNLFSVDSDYLATLDTFRHLADEGTNEY